MTQFPTPQGNTLQIYVWLALVSRSLEACTWASQIVSGMFYAEEREVLNCLCFLLC